MRIRAVKPDTRVSGADGNRVKDLSWPIKALLIGSALVVGFFDHSLGYWGASIVPAFLAFIVPILLLRRFWKQARFWITVGVLAIAQAGLVIAIRPSVQHYGLVFMLPFGIADCMLVIIVLFQVCSQA